MARRIFIARHGETKWSLSGQHTGMTDLPLLPEGEEQAKKLGKRLQKEKFSHVFSSPLQRAHNTCKLAGFDGVIEEALLEWNYGQYEGITSEEIHKSDPGWTIFSNGAPGGESIDAVQKRCDVFLKKLAKLDGDVLLFSSGHISRAMGAAYLGLSISFGRHLLLSPASLSILGFEKKDPAIVSWNETDYLH